MENAAAYTKTGGSQLPRRRSFTSTDCYVGLYSRHIRICRCTPFFLNITREPPANIKSLTVRARTKRHEFKQLASAARIISQFLGVYLNTVRAIGMITRCFLISCGRYSFVSRAGVGCENRSVLWFGELCVSSRARVWVVSYRHQSYPTPVLVSSRERV